MINISSVNIEAEDKVLIEGIKHGNTAVYDIVFTRFYSALVCHAVMNNVPDDDAEDLVQEVFFKLWLNREKLEIHTSLRNYLFVAVKNNCNDYFRHQKAEQNLHDKIQSQISTEEPTNDDDRLVESELRELINTAINKLPEKCRRVFILYRFKNKKVSEIAEMENITPRTVETHIGKAYKMLRQELKDYLPMFVTSIILSSQFPPI